MSRIETLSAVLAVSVEEAWDRVRALHDEPPYAFGPYTTDEAAYVVPTSNTEAGLTKAAEAYRARDGGDLALHRASLRWSMADWPAHGKPGRTFRSWEAHRRVAAPRALIQALLGALALCDARGVFGEGEARLHLTLGVWMGDQSDSQRLAWVRKANPPAVAERFAREQREARAAWKALESRS